MVLAFVATGCAHHDRQGHWVRSGPARFDAQSVSAPGIVYTLEEDGTWAGLDGDRYERVGDDRVFRIEPLQPEATRLRFLYLHGGAYVHEVQDIQWNVAAGLVKRVPAGIVAPMYPLAP